MGGGCLVAVLLPLVGFNAGAAEAEPAAAPETIANSDCLDCHLEPDQVRTVNGKEVPMPVFPTNTFDLSVHAILDCVDCHAGIKELVHASNLPPPICAECHEDEAKAYATSIHGVSHKLGASGAANCWDCHGSHDILPVNNPASPVFKLNLPRTCAKCHSNPGLTKEYEMKYPRGGVRIRGQHPRTRLAENGIDCGAVVRRLPRRA